MVRRICPICDQMMESSHYCRNCRAFVKNPYFRDTDYYLNERHPADAHECTYHEEGRGGLQGQGAQAQPERTYHRQGSQAASGRMAKTERSITRPEAGALGRTGTEQSGRKKSNPSAILVIVLIFIVIQFVVPILIQVIHMMRWWF